MKLNFDILSRFDPKGLKQAEKGLDNLADKGRKSGDESGRGFVVGWSKRIKGFRVGSFLRTGAGKAAGALGGMAAGAAFMEAFKEALDQGDANAKLRAQLDLGAADSKRVGKLAGDLFKSNYGESMSDVSGVIRKVVQDTNTSVRSVNLGPITKQVMSLASTFEQDAGAITRGVGQMVRTGLAKNASQALDIITKGFQKGADKSEDFMDTLNEYGTLFRNMGLSGAQATGILVQGLQAGARDSDKVADAIKEFSIRAVDGSELTANGFKMLGLNADEMASKIGKGGKSSREALDVVLTRLRGIKDPVKQSQAAVALFGTQAEDLGRALFAIDPSKAVDSLGQVGGAAKELDSTVSNTTQNSLKGLWRSIQQNVVEGLGAAIEAFETGEVKSGGFKGAMETLGVVLADVWRGIGPIIKWAWENVISPVLQGLAWGLRQLPGVLQWLHEVWTEIWSGIGTVIAEVGTVILRGLQGVFDGVTWMIEKLIEAGNFVGLFSDETESDFKNWRKGVSRSFDGAVDDLQGWKNELQKAPKIVKLEGNIRDLDEKIKKAEREIKKVPKSKRTDMQAKIDDLKRKRRLAQAELDKLKGKTVSPIDADTQPARRKISAFLRRDITRVERRFKAIVDADTRPGARRIRDFIKQQQNKGIVLSSSGEFIGFRGTGGPRLPSSRFKAAGGPIDGPGTSRSDSIPAMLSKGEYVVNAESTRKHYALIEAINRDKVPGFASGGIAGRAAIKIPVDVDTSGWKSFLNRMASSGFGPGPTPRTGNMRIVRDIFARMFGWGAHWGATYRLLMKESGFNNTAQNPTSTAYGMFQFLDSTWGGYGIRKTSDPRLQTIAGGRYIRARYGNPSRALAFHLAHNWYEQGTPWVPEDQIAMVHKGEAIVPRDVNEARLKQKPIDPKELGEAMAAALVRRLERSGKRLSLQPVGARADMFGRTEP